MKKNPIDTDVHIAVITSRFNKEITARLFSGATERLKYHGLDKDQVIEVWVPGAIEIPLVAQHLAKRGDVDAIIGLGAVIRGETSHYDYVCSQVSEGCAKVSYDYGLPVIFGVLASEPGVRNPLTKPRKGLRGTRALAAGRL